jgi:xylose dehydrogenase (NAD/NADP)
MDTTPTLDEHREAFEARDWAVEGVAEEGPLRFALLGLGLFTRNSVLPAIEDSDLATASCLVSGSREKAERVAAEAGADHALTYEEYHEGAASDGYDAVFVCTPNALHLEAVETAADLGKAVLCEKPMAATVEGAEGIVAACADADVPLMIAYRMQTDPGVRWARELVRDGYVGEPIHARGSMSQRLFGVREDDPGQWRLDPDLAGGSSLIDLGIYPINTLRFLVDADPEAVQAIQRSPDDPFAGVDEHVSFEARYGDGTLLAGTASQNAYEEGHLHLTGSEGELALESAFMGPVRVRVDGDHGEARVGFEDVDEVFEELEYFATCVLAGRDPHPDGEHGLVDMQTIAAMYRSAETGERVEVPTATDGA